MPGGKADGRSLRVVRRSATLGRLEGYPFDVRYSDGTLPQATVLDFSIFKYDISALDESDRARVIDFDWNESFALCEMNVELAVEIEAFIPKKGDLRVSVLAVEGGCEGPA
jgi:hypothetical protein